MNGKDLLYGMNFVDDKFVEEAEMVMLNKRKSLHWRSYLATVACFILVVVTAIFLSINLMVLQMWILSENEIKTSDIDGIAVTFGYCSMPYGPYHSETHEPFGYYDMYVAEFAKDGIDFQIVAHQMEVEELVKVVASIIRGDANIKILQ